MQVHLPDVPQTTWWQSKGMSKNITSPTPRGQSAHMR